MRKLLLLFFLASLIILPRQTAAQSDQVPLAWSKRISQINWMRITTLGYPLVGSLGTLSALDPATGEVMWQLTDRGTITEDRVDEIPGTGYVRLAYGVQRGEENTLPMIALVDILTGAVVFDSEREDLGILGTYPLPQSRKMLVVGVKPGATSAKLLMYDMDSGRKLWQNEDLFKAQSGGKGILAKMAATVQNVLNMQSLTSDPVEIDATSIIITHPSFVIKLNSADGAVIWRAKIEESARAQLIATGKSPGVIYVATEITTQGMQTPTSDGTNYVSQYYAFNEKTGQSVWTSSVRNNNERIGFVIPAENGLILFPGLGTQLKSSMNLVDYKTGATLWGQKGKGVKVDGAVMDFMPVGDGRIAIATAAVANNLNKGFNYFLNIIDEKTGTLGLEKSVKVEGRFVRTQLVEQGLLFITTNEVNILNTNTGKLVLPESIVSGGPKRPDRVLPFPTASAGDKLYVFSTKEGILKELDKKTGQVRSINSTRLELGQREFPKGLDVFEDGVVVSSDQNIVKIGFDGKLLYNHYFPAPRETKFMRALALAEAIKGVYVAFMLASVSKDMMAASRNAPEEFASMARGAAQISGGLALTSLSYTGRALADFNRRFKATTVTDQYMIILTEAAPRDFRLVQVDKDSGKTIQTISLGNDRDPIYSLDFVDNYLYWQSRPSELSCFKLR